MFMCIFVFFLVQKYRAISRLLKTFFTIWFGISYFLMTSFGSNLLVRAISIESNKVCQSKVAILLANGMMRYTVNEHDYGAMSMESLNRVHVARNWLLSNEGNRLLLTGSLANNEIQILNNYLNLIGVSNEKLFIENLSSTTYESAINSRKLISKSQEIVLITSQIHMRRANLTFNSVGYDICPLVANNQYVNVSGIKSLFPDSHAIIKSEKVLHELFGIIWYWLTDRI